MTTALTPSKYTKLISDLSAILDKGRQDALSAVNQIKLETSALLTWGILG